jgi:hypothetical protein
MVVSAENGGLCVQLLGIPFTVRIMGSFLVLLQLCGKELMPQHTRICLLTITPPGLRMQVLGSLLLAIGMSQTPTAHLVGYLARGDTPHCCEFFMSPTDVDGGVVNVTCVHPGRVFLPCHNGRGMSWSREWRCELEKSGATWSRKWRCELEKSGATLKIYP